MNGTLVLSDSRAIPTGCTERTSARWASVEAACAESRAEKGVHEDAVAEHDRATERPDLADRGLLRTERLGGRVSVRRRDGRAALGPAPQGDVGRGRRLHLDEVPAELARADHRRDVPVERRAAVLPEVVTVALRCLRRGPCGALDEQGEREPDGNDH
jgi:hypothetical protein